MRSKFDTVEMQLSDKALAVQSMFDRIAPRYDLLNRILSLRQDLKWRRHMCRKLPFGLGRDQSVLDVACGTGDVIEEILRSRPDYSDIYGLDLSGQMLEKAGERESVARVLVGSGRSVPASQAVRHQAQARQPQVHLVHGTATALPFDDSSFHAVTIAFGFRNIDDRRAALREFFRVLRPGGSLFVLEFFPVSNHVFGRLFDFYFRKVLPMIGGVFSDRDAYRYLPDSVTSMPDMVTFCGHLEQAGLVFRSSRSWLFGGCRLVEALKEYEMRPPQVREQLDGGGPGFCV
jgi:demethylmenaquinone methyltransferase/2-methoxy-6-polyprenyl-1,4-benzoquinol methylase